MYQDISDSHGVLRGPRGPRGRPLPTYLVPGPRVFDEEGALGVEDQEAVVFFEAVGDGAGSIRLIPQRSRRSVRTKHRRSVRDLLIHKCQRCPDT
jgi:hypothetical protein